MSFCAMIPLLALGASTFCGADASAVSAAEATGDLLQSSMTTAAVEAGYTIAAFLVAALAIRVMQTRTLKAKRKRIAERKAKALETHSPRDGKSARRSAVVPSRRDMNCEEIMAAVRGGRAADLPAIFAASRTAAMRRGLSGDALAAVIGHLLQSALRACASRRCFQEGLAAYDEAMQTEGGVNANDSILSLLLYCSVEAQQFERVPMIIERLVESTLPSSNDFVNIVRYYAHEHDLEGLKRMMVLLNGRGFVPDVITRNRGLTACACHKAVALAEVLADDETMGSKMDIIGYNSLMKCYVDAGQCAKCLAAYDVMRGQGKQPTEVTFGVLLDACNDAADAERASEVFAELRASGMHMNVIHYTTFMKALAKGSRLDAANELLDEMLRSRHVKPDAVMYSTLIKANVDRGSLGSAMRVLEKMREHGTQPDNVVCNIVLSGLLTEKMESRLVMHVFNKLTCYGMTHTTTTLSMLLKALARTHDWTMALGTLEHAHERYKLHAEARLFGQLGAACASAGAAEKALDCYFAMLRNAAARGISVDEAMSSRMCQQHCSETAREGILAAKLHALVLSSAGRVSLEDLETLAQER